MITVHTYKAVQHLHAHAHALCSEGILDREGVYHRLPKDFDWSPLAELLRRTVLEMLVGRERLSPQTQEMLLHWRHSGFEAVSFDRSGARHGRSSSPGCTERML